MTSDQLKNSSAGASEGLLGERKAEEVVEEDLGHDESDSGFLQQHRFEAEDPRYET